mmetsp:Transcript_151365/g.384740  ORF Transcript_151365/g.384740 Transcript_151365/m.384740 type:complete len:233 (-) Transcript_151365:666-1364(-)
MHHGRQAKVLHQLLLPLQACVTESRWCRVRAQAHQRMLQALVECQDVLWRLEVYKGKAAMDVAALVKGHVKERVAVIQAEVGQDLHEVLAGARLGNVANHNCGACVSATANLLRNNVKLGEVLGVNLLPHRLAWPCRDWTAFRHIGRRGAQWNTSCKRCAGRSVRLRACWGKAVSQGVGLRHVEASRVVVTLRGSRADNPWGDSLAMHCSSGSTKLRLDSTERLCEALQQFG